MTTPNRIAECKWGPFDGEQWGIPDTRILILRQVDNDYTVHVSKLLRSGDLPKRFRDDATVVGWYNFVIEFSPGLPLMNNDDEWSTVAYHMWYPKSEGMNNEVEPQHKTKRKPLWLQDGTDIDNMDGEHDSSDDWKR